MSGTGTNRRPSESSAANRAADPRQCLIDATLEVVAERGVRGLSHRRVAKVSGMALGAANYHFGTLENLLEQAFVDAIERDCAVLDGRLKQLPPGTDLARELAVILHDQLSEPGSFLTNELLVAALASEQLRPLARSWARRWQEAFLPFVGDEVTATLAVALTGGIVQIGLMSDPPMTVDEIEVLLRRGLAVR